MKRPEKVAIRPKPDDDAPYWVALFVAFILFMVFRVPAMTALLGS